MFSSQVHTLDVLLIYVLIFQISRLSLRFQSCLNCHIILISSKYFQEQKWRLHELGPWNLIKLQVCITGMKSIIMTKHIVHCVPSILSPFLKKTLCWSLSYSNVITILTTSAFLTFWMNRFLRAPNGRSNVMKMLQKWQRAFNNMARRIIWVTFVKGLEAVAMSLRKQVNSKISGAL